MNDLTALYSTDDVPCGFQNVSGYSDHGEAINKGAQCSPMIDASLALTLFKR
jgi:hypothetical protein